MKFLRKQIEYALTATLIRTTKRKVKECEADACAKFKAVLISFIHHMQDNDFYKQKFGTNAKALNVIRVIDMIEDDLTLIDDPDILEQIYKK